jgi:hypothetical protein
MSLKLNAFPKFMNWEKLHNSCKNGFARVHYKPPPSVVVWKYGFLMISFSIGSESWEWIPQDFECFLEELKAIGEHCDAIGHIPIYRELSNRKWLLDSTCEKLQTHTFL